MNLFYTLVGNDDLQKAHKLRKIDGAFSPKFEIGFDVDARGYIFQGMI